MATAALVAPIGAVGAASAAGNVPGTAVDTCEVIDDPGQYSLNQSLSNPGTSPCIVVESSDVIFDGRNETVDGATRGVMIGNGSSAVSNVTVRNLTVENADTGVQLSVATGSPNSDLVVRNVTMTDVSTGVHSASNQDQVPLVGISVHDSTIHTTGDGIRIDSQNDEQYDVELSGNVIDATAGSYGVEVAAPDDGTDVGLSMRRNEVTTSDSTGLDLALERSNAHTDLDLHHNRINVAGSGAVHAVGLENSELASDTNATVDLSVTNNTLGSPGDALFLYMAGDDGHQDVSIVDNVVTSDTRGFEAVAKGTNTSVGMTVTDNEIDAADGVYLDMAPDSIYDSYPNQTLDLDVRRNNLTGEARFDADGSGADADAVVANNTFDDASTSLRLNLVRDNATKAVDVRENRLNGSAFLNLGGGNGTTTLAATNNTVESGSTNLEVQIQPNDAPNQTVDATVRDNVVHGDWGINVYAGPPSSSTTLAVTDNRITSPDAGGSSEALLVRLDGDNLTAAADISRNTVLDGADEGIKATTAGVGTTAAIAVENNTIDAGADPVHLFPTGDDQDLDLDVRGNDLNVTTEGTNRQGVVVSDTGRNSALDVSATNNSIDSTLDGIELHLSHGEGDGDDPIDLEVRDNDIQTANDGVWIHDDDTNDAATDRNLTVDIVNNTIDSQESAIWLETRNNFGSDDVTVSDNQIDATNAAGVSLGLGGGEADINVTVDGNTVEADSFQGLQLTLGVEDSIFAGDPGPRNVTVTDNDVTADAEGIYLRAEEERMPVNATVTGNVVQSTDGILAEVSADEMHVDADLSRNDLTVQDDGLTMEAFAPNMTTAVRVADNDVAPGAQTGIALHGGDNDTATWTVRDNLVERADTGIELDGIQILDAPTFDVTVRSNDVVDATAVGLFVGPEGGSQARSGTVLVEGNDVSSDATTVRIGDGPVTGIELTRNRFDANGYGVENLNTTPGSAVDARDNYWGAADGPGSGGPYEDPATGTLADGTGSNVTNATPTVSNVRFDPYLTSPPSLQRAPNFTVAVDGTNSPVTVGEALRVSATVENTGRGSGVQDLSLSVGGSDRNSTRVTLSSGATATRTVVWNTTGASAGTYTATLATENQSAAIQVDLQAPSNSNTGGTGGSSSSGGAPAAGSGGGGGGGASGAAQVSRDTPASTSTPANTATESTTATATADATDTPAATTADSPTATETSASTPGETGPGFGVVVALVALLAAATLWTRRD